MITLERIDRGIKATVESGFVLAVIHNLHSGWKLWLEDVQGVSKRSVSVNALTCTTEYTQAFSFDNFGRTVVEFKLKENDYA